MGERNRVNEPTAVNRENMPTTFNREMESTAINRELQSDTSADTPVQIQMGTIVADKYTVISKLDKASGEADLYVAEYEGKKYVIKLYRRENAAKPEILQMLLETNHPNLPRVYDIGMLMGKQYEVMEYYENGSMEGVILSEQELREHFIPDMNEALHELERMDIVHKDIKPSNIAKNDKGHYVLMDFGISSIRKNGVSQVMTKTGLTMDYSAPESLGMGATWSNLSDYYSLGVSIYELLLGRLPFDGMDAEQKSQYKTLNTFPIPENVSEDFRKLILGMTYADIHNRHDKSNVNNRWDYSFVKDWLDGKEMVIPGTGVTVAEPTHKAFEFENRMCKNTDEIMDALAHNWDTAMKYVARDLLYEYFKSEGMNSLANGCMDVAQKGTDEALMQYIYDNTSMLDEICWKNVVVTPVNLGKDILTELWSCMNVYNSENMKKFDKFRSLFSSHVLEAFYLSRSRGAKAKQYDRERAQLIGELVQNILRTSGEKRDQKKISAFYVDLFQLAYVLVSKRILRIGNDYYEDYDRFLADYEKNYQEMDAEEFDRFVANIAYWDSNDSGKHRYTEQFLAWTNLMEEISLS